MKENALTLEAVKKENKELKAQLAKLHREQGSQGLSGQEREKEKLETRVHQLRY